MHKKYLATGSKVQLHPQCPQLRSFSRKYPRNNWGVWIVGRVIVWQIGWDGSNRTLHSTLKHIYLRRNWESPSQPASSQIPLSPTRRAGLAWLPGHHISACRSHRRNYNCDPPDHVSCYSCTLHFIHSGLTNCRLPPAPDISTFQAFWKVYPLIEWEDFESQPKSGKLSLVYQDSGDF